MGPDAEVVAALIAFITTGAFALIGLRMFLGYKAKRLQAGNPEASSETEHALADLRDQVALMRNDLVELQERVDFTERMLTRGQTAERLPGKP